ncbi:site-specific integrase [Nonomuraea sp. NPDC048916]|uniref:site-specific integrase n=1 Tax=Nonomuraea sp. NPDC048916 TaxID=3154232 RepID=UPI00340E7B7C
MHPAQHKINLSDNYCSWVPQPERAEYLFKQATKSIDPTGAGFTLHQLRHSRLTHLGEDGWSASMLMALSGHRNLRTLGVYIQPSTEAVAAALAEHDPGRRRH